MGRFCFKTFACGKDVLLAIADSNIVGKKFEEGDVQILVSEDFYCGRGCGDKEVLILIKNSTIVNAVGKGIIGLMVKEGIVGGKSVITIDGVPHAQVVSGV